MWAHYADAHRGFCVGFDSARLDTLGNEVFVRAGLGSYISPVHYVKKFPVVDSRDLAVPEKDNMRRFVTSKSRHWQYEREYRFVLAVKDEKRTHRFQNDALVQVILGCRMTREDEAEIKQILSERTPKPQLLRATMRPGEYAFEFKSVEY